MPLDRKALAGAEAALLSTAPSDGFRGDELAGLPEPVVRYFTASLSPGAAVARAARLCIRGYIRIGRWLPFTSTELLDPHRGFLWRAKVAGGLVSGFDRYLDGTAAMRWSLLGLVPVVRATGPDLVRSAAARAGAEGIWVPSAMLPRFGVAWSVAGVDSIVARFAVDDVPVEIRHELDRDGRIRASSFQRWGDPDRSGRWGWQRCGGEVSGYGTFGGSTIPTAGRFGWHYGTDRWAEGEFFRYEITALALPGVSPGRAKGSGRD
jgi:hypothetical protein